MYNKYKEGFYVNAQRDLTNISQVARYIGRYLVRPAIAEYRIIKYDRKKVTFWYENKNPKKKDRSLSLIHILDETIENLAIIISEGLNRSLHPGRA